MKSKLLSLIVLYILQAGFTGSQLLAQSTSEKEQLIPFDNRIDWDPGIPGGVPDIEGPVSNILDFGADPSGKNDSWSSFMQAIENLPDEGGVVLIPEGNFLLESKLSLSKANIVLRGTGPGSRILSASSDNSIEILASNSGEWQKLNDGALKGRLQLMVENGSLFTPGQFAEIEQDNDPKIMYTKENWKQLWSENSVGQHFEIIAVEDNTVTFRAPLNYTYSANLNSRIRPLDMIKNVGIEDLYIEKIYSAMHTIYFRNSAYCWIKNVESYKTRRTHIHMVNSLGNEIRDSYFHLSYDYGGGGSGYGVECGRHVTNCLVENNTFDSLRHAMLIQVGANGNVYGYNYSTNPIGAAASYAEEGWIPPDISIHGHYPFMNLFEGNEVHEIGIADYWGPAGPGNTYFRNKVTDEGIFYYDASEDQNLIGNVTSFLTDESGIISQKFEHGNVVNSETQWDPTMPDHHLPSSLYLEIAPEFFYDLAWPCFGPDINEERKLPAQLRIENRLPSVYYQ